MSHKELQWTAISHIKSQERKVNHSKLQWNTISYSKTQWVTINNRKQERGTVSQNEPKRGKTRCKQQYVIVDHHEPKWSIMNHIDPEQVTTRLSQIWWAKKNTDIHNDSLIKSVIMVCSCQKYEINQKHSYLKKRCLILNRKKVMGKAQLKNFCFPVTWTNLLKTTWLSKILSIFTDTTKFLPIYMFIKLLFNILQYVKFK